MNLITYDKNRKIFHLSNNEISYIFKVNHGILNHLYYGKKIKEYHQGREYQTSTRGSWSPNLPGTKDNEITLDAMLQEVPGNNQGDFRIPSYIIRHSDGSNVTNFKYKSHEIVAGKPKIKGMPATYLTDPSEAHTLNVLLKDKESDLELTIQYTIFRDSPIITKSSSLRNPKKEPVFVEKLMSTSLDFENQDLDVLYLHGTWGSERHIKREPVSYGIKLLDSKKGASSHTINPFVALMSPKATETQGEVYGFSLVYSGEHEIAIEKDSYEKTRIQIGINSYEFTWKLSQDEIFDTPEVVMVYSNEGIGKMSRTYHSLYNHHLVRGKYKLKERPVLINNWEATHMDFTEEKIVNLAQKGKEIGLELLVLDDGWFGNRNDDTTSLGDWFVNKGKLPNGLDKLGEAVEKELDFGLWFEPEMVSEDSELYKEHPDWVLHVPYREKSPARNQYILDFGRQEVRDKIYEMIKSILTSVPVSYIKWDMNRNMSEVFATDLPHDEQGKVKHRYILGLYDILERLNTDFPELLLESCAGGGGRFDPGMLYYMPQTWTSDNTDPITRLKIQYGTSIVYPISSMGAHVSASPNLQTGRISSLETRGNVAMSGVFGYEMDLTKATESELAEMKKQVKFYKQHRELIQYGNFYRLLSPFDSNLTAWMFVSEEKDEAIVFFFKILSEAMPPINLLKLQGLDSEEKYKDNEGNVYGGDELMNMGFFVKRPHHEGKKEDFTSQVYYFKKL